jgi:hypothetical protein
MESLLCEEAEETVVVDDDGKERGEKDGSRG